QTRPRDRRHDRRRQGAGAALHATDGRVPGGLLPPEARGRERRIRRPRPRRGVRAGFIGRGVWGPPFAGRGWAAGGEVRQPPFFRSIHTTLVIQASRRERTS